MRRGLYFLADDAVFDWVSAFLASLRRVEPSLPVCLVPFSEHVGKVAALGRHFDFSVFPDLNLLEAADAIGRRFFPGGRGEFRKLALWEGPFDEFVYIDVDTILLRPVTPLLALLQCHDVVFSSSHVPGARRWTWRDSIEAAGLLPASMVESAANTGFFLSRAGRLALSDLIGLLAGIGPLVQHMELRCKEQPFLNYAIAALELKATSLYHLRHASGYFHLPQECWAGDEGWSGIRQGCSRHEGVPIDVLFVHWAGLGRGGTARDVMPMRGLWQEFAATA